eukprot:TRINITY_DN424_c0_g2_i1.p1 TRINITY_DN424_c0_g2~~TRINITY_DN424_c0_g2_i1.p1  ORF type:complete len:246 (+),score=100.41 TRINITY_DN424_c0_g2_i1:98-835(+)
MRGTALAAAVVVAVSTSFAVKTFVGLTGSQGLHATRDVAVARGVNTCGIICKGGILDLKEKSDDDLHSVIAESKKNLWDYRLQVFRKKKPHRSIKFKNLYKIAMAKTLLSQRKNDLEAKDVEGLMARVQDAYGSEKVFEEGPIMTALRDPEESLEAMKAFSQRPGKRQQNKKAGSATPKRYTRSEWYYVSPEEREAMATELSALREKGTFERIVEDTKAAVEFKQKIKADREAEQKAEAEVAKEE